MAKLKPWYMVLEPREDLRENRRLDPTEFAVHIDHVRDGSAHIVYRDPVQFFSRTYFTDNLRVLCAEVIRRLSGFQSEAAPIFNMMTQFGGGKTHALTALYHLATGGPEASRWAGVDKVLKLAQVDRAPKAKVGVVVGTELDVLKGRGGHGEPQRRTPWGELAWQLGGAKAFSIVAEHDAKIIAPGGDVLREMLPAGPTLILLDELLSYASRFRKEGGREELYNFLHILTEVARARTDLVLCVSIPKSDIEMSPEDERDFTAFKKVLDRLGKAVTLSANLETIEIVRRRLFEWSNVLPDDAKKVVAAYAEWATQHKDEIAGLDVGNARDAFAACYPFHPSVVSVFERKWQMLPRFQRTRGVLRLLAQWVARACTERNGAPLITLGTAPLDDPWFRAAVFEQLGDERLEGAVTTDIAGRKDAHAFILDQEAPEAIKKAKLHRRVATVIFFESNGGQSQSRAIATRPEIRAAIGDVEGNLAEVDQALEALEARSYFLTWDGDKYRFSTTPNLNKVLVSQRSSIDLKEIDDRLSKETEKLFKEGGKELERRFFPTMTNDVPDRAKLTLVVLELASAWPDTSTTKRIEELYRECGHSGRSFKAALTFAVAAAGSQSGLRDVARTALAWEAIDKDAETKANLDETQRRLLAQQLGRAKGDLRDALLRAYRHVVVLGKDAKPKELDLGQVHASAGALAEQIKNRLQEQDEVTDGVGPTKLVKNWPTALKEWSTKAARDAFFASPLLPRLLNPDSIRDTIARGVSEKSLALAKRQPTGELVLLRFGTPTKADDVELDDDVLLLRAEDALRLEEPPVVTRLQLRPDRVHLDPGKRATFTAVGIDQYGKPFPVGSLTWRATGGSITEAGVFTAGQEPGRFDVEADAGGVAATAEVTIIDGSEPPPKQPGHIHWTGTIPPQKWMTFYTKVLSRLANIQGLKLRVEFEAPAPGDEAQAKALAEAAEAGLRDLGLEVPDTLLE